jgi:hypothetical protein
MENQDATSTVEGCTKTELLKTLKSVEMILTRIEARFEEHFPSFEESKNAAKRLVATWEKEEYEKRRAAAWEKEEADLDRLSVPDEEKKRNAELQESLCTVGGWSPEAFNDDCYVGAIPPNISEWISKPVWGCPPGEGA